MRNKIKNKKNLLNKLQRKCAKKSNRRCFCLSVILLSTFLILGIGIYFYALSVNKISSLSEANFEKIKFEEKVKEMTIGHPIEKMIPYILEKETRVAAFLISIAKKESNWGKRKPVLNGKDCYNYWGYRGIRPRMGSGGHTCFENPKDAVDTVAKRIKYLVNKRELNTPEKMIIWKCGNSCAGHNQKSVQKWIGDVKLYFDKLVPS